MAKPAVSIKIEGIEDLIANLDRLVPELRYKTGRSTMRKVANEMAAKTIAAAPVGETGNLANAIRPSVKIFEPDAIVAFAKIDYGTGKGNHAHLIEFGHANVKGGKRFGLFSKGRVIGYVKPYPFMRPTLYSNEDRWLKLALEAVEKSLKRLQKKGKI